MVHSRPFGRTSVDYGGKAGESGIVGHQTLANEYRVFPVKESHLHGASTIPVAMSKAWLKMKKSRVKLGSLLWR